jgi:hypothetical protein
LCQSKFPSEQFCRFVRTVICFIGLSKRYIPEWLLAGADRLGLLKSPYHKAIRLDGGGRFTLPEVDANKIANPSRAVLLVRLKTPAQAVLVSVV